MRYRYTSAQAPQSSIALQKPQQNILLTSFRPVLNERNKPQNSFPPDLNLLADFYTSNHSKVLNLKNHPHYQLVTNFIPWNEATIPNNEAAIPNNEATIPNNEAAIPNNEAAIPNNEAVIPDNEATIPNNEAAVPNNEAIIPDNQAIVPGNEVLVNK